MALRVGKQPAGIEGLKAANTLTAQVITVASGLLAFTVTFAEKFTPAGRAIALPITLKLSWGCFVLTIFFGFWTLLAVAGTLLELDRGRTETNPNRTNINFPGRCMFVLFFFGVSFLGVAGWCLGN
jgi:hypothetical protein